MSTSTQNSDNWDNFILLAIVAYWWVLPAVLGFLGAAFELGRQALRTHHKRKLAIARERARIATAAVQVDAYHAKMAMPYAPVAPLPPGAGPCKHRSDVVPVFEEATGKRVAWFCKTCETQLPATYAVSPEDL